jgi:FKBP-type peptidyl-prolyl cis-trans isomerase
MAKLSRQSRTGCVSSSLFASSSGLFSLRLRHDIRSSSKSKSKSKRRVKATGPFAQARERERERETTERGIEIEKNDAAESRSRSRLKNGIGNNNRHRSRSSRRRQFGLAFAGTGVGLAGKGFAAAEEERQPKYKRSPLGVPYEDVYGGDGSASGRGEREASKVEKGDEVVVDYILRRSNGYFIYGTVEGVSFQPLDVPTEPFRFVVGEDERVIPGLSDVVLGMRKNGKRRALVPPRFGYNFSAGANDENANAPLTLEPIPPTFATRRQLLNHRNEPLLFEIQVVKVIKH